MDNNNQAIEALKAGHVDVVLLDGAQGAIFSQKIPPFLMPLSLKRKMAMALRYPNTPY